MHSNQTLNTPPRSEDSVENPCQMQSSEPADRTGSGAGGRSYTRRPTIEPGSKFWRLEAIRKVNSSGRERWLWECECGTQKEIDGACVKRGTIKSCGCWNKDPAKPRPGKPPLTVLSPNQKIGRLTIIKSAPPVGRRPAWVCKCDCGEMLTVIDKEIKNGHTGSCGCLKRDLTSQRMTKHGLTAGGNVTPEFKIWCEMRKRCIGAGGNRFKRYKGRGITICQRWLNSADAFVADVGLRPSPDHSIDRIDVDGHYSCGKCEECIREKWTANCKWSTEKEQQRNKGNTRWVVYNGERRALSEWCEILNLNYGFIFYRLGTGWSVEDAFTIPSRKKARDSLSVA